MSTITGIMTCNFYGVLCKIRYVEEHVHDNRDYDDYLELFQINSLWSKSMSTITGIMTEPLVV